MNYSDPGELSWVDEGLADFAVFLNGYPTWRLAPDLPPGVPPRDVAHPVGRRPRELRRLVHLVPVYLWEQAGGNGDGTYEPDLEYDAAGGDLLIKLIFEDQADGMEGIQTAIDATTPDRRDDLRSARSCSRTGRRGLPRRRGLRRLRHQGLDFGDPDFAGLDDRDRQRPVLEEPRAATRAPRPRARSPLAEGARADRAAVRHVLRDVPQPGPDLPAHFDGEDESRVAPHTGEHALVRGLREPEPTTSSTSTPPVTGGQTVDFWTWYFIEEGWDYGFVEALVGGEWVTVPLVDDAGTAVTTDTNPHDNNDEGNGLTGPPAAPTSSTSRSTST